MRTPAFPMIFSLAVTSASWLHAAPPGQGPDSVKICEFLRAKAMPSEFAVEAIPFTGPSGDGRRGSAGFLVDAPKLTRGSGTRFRFSFERAASGFGFQVIHPMGDGHILVSVHPSVRLYTGGSWAEIGWGNPATCEKKLKLESAAEDVFPMKQGRGYQVVSELSPGGKYRLLIDDQLICEHQVEGAKPLVLETPKSKEEGGDGSWIYLGSGWDRTGFAGGTFTPKLQRGHAGLVLGPMDGSGPTQNFRHVSLGALRPGGTFPVPKAN